MELSITGFPIKSGNDDADVEGGVEIAGLVLSIGIVYTMF